VPSLEIGLNINKINTKIKIINLTKGKADIIFVPESEIIII